MPGMRKYFLVAFILLIVDILCGCGVKTSSESFIREDTELGYVQRVAVLPFENFSDDEYAAARARDFTITQCLAMGLFDVVGKGIVDSTLQEEVIKPGAPLDISMTRRLGQRLNVQAILQGSVDYSGEGRKGNFSFPELSLTLQLIDCDSPAAMGPAIACGDGCSAWRPVTCSKLDWAQSKTFSKLCLPGKQTD
jgi:TolB-like protein